MDAGAVRRAGPGLLAGLNAAVDRVTMLDPSFTRAVIGVDYPDRGNTTSDDPVNQSRHIYVQYFVREFC